MHWEEKRSSISIAAVGNSILETNLRYKKEHNDEEMEEKSGKVIRGFFIFFLKMLRLTLYMKDSASMLEDVDLKFTLLASLSSIVSALFL